MNNVKCRYCIFYGPSLRSRCKYFPVMWVAFASAFYINYRTSVCLKLRRLGLPNWIINILDFKQSEFIRQCIVCLHVVQRDPYSRVYLLSCELKKQIWCILRYISHRLQSNKQKARKNNQNYFSLFPSSAGRLGFDL